jgi:hypothetical protein
MTHGLLLSGYHDQSDGISCVLSRFFAPSTADSLLLLLRSLWTELCVSILVTSGEARPQQILDALVCTACCHLMGIDALRVLLDPQHEGTNMFRNVVKHLPNDLLTYSMEQRPS